jgi:hypothetical protein
MYLTLIIPFFPNPPASSSESKYSRFYRALNKAKNRLLDESLSLQLRGVFGFKFHVSTLQCTKLSSFPSYQINQPHCVNRNTRDLTFERAHHSNPYTYLSHILNFKWLACNHSYSVFSDLHTPQGYHVLY